MAHVMNDSLSAEVLLGTIVELSHEFGGPDYVCGGGGNTSVKTVDTLWVKPSGTTLASLTADRMVPIERSRLQRLYEQVPPGDPASREAWVREVMTAAQRTGVEGRASVEAPLHDTFSRRFVVHTHPALVNGLTCAWHGEAAAHELFPDAMWVPYVDPGYTLCMEIRRRLQAVRGTPEEPKIVLLQNHGVFIAADSADEMRALYRRLMGTLCDAYQRRGIPSAWKPPPPVKPDEAERVRTILHDVLGTDGAAVAICGLFEVASGPLSPDHIVYARSFPMMGPITPATVTEYRRRYGLSPRIVATPTAVAGVADTRRLAELALELAQDAAFVVRLTKAFGGPHFLDDAARLFIEQWEVESYRQSVSAR